MPDFLLDHTLLGKEPSDRIQEYSRRWTQFVSGLWRSKGDVTYGLRFDLNQKHKRIDTYILGRFHTPTNDSQNANQALILLTDLERILESLGFEPKSLTESQLQDLVANYSYRYCLEVCQEEVITPIRQDTPITGGANTSVMMFFLTLLREYRELHPSPELTHITLVEEAHNVLANVDAVSSGSENQSDVKAKSIQSFCNMLAEVRAYGEGLIIADQSPEKLARDAMRNTNVQIVHQLRDAQDRDAIANAMIMSEEQRDFLGKCETGRAAIFYTGLQKATFIDVPVYKDPAPPNYEGKTRIENRYQGFTDHLNPHISDREVREYMRQFSVIQAEEIACSLCRFQCEYRDQILRLAEEGKERFKEALDYFNEVTSDKKTEAFNTLAKEIIQITQIKEEKELDLAWCYTKEMWLRLEGEALEEDRKEQFVDVFKDLI